MGKNKKLVLFDYDDYYEKRSDSYSEFIRLMGRRKALLLKKFLQNIDQKNIIAEVGTGPGDVLNTFNEFKFKIGLDISISSLQKHINNYFQEQIVIKDSQIDFDTFYIKKISKREIFEGFKLRPVFSDKNLFLIKTKPNKPLPFEDKSIDCLLLCDIVEHVEQPIEFLKDAARITDILLLKFPVEKAILYQIMNKVRGIKYGVNHSSGHLFYWNENEIFWLLQRSNIEVLSYEFEPSKFEFSESKFFIKEITFCLMGFLDRIFSKKWFFTRNFLGGSLYIYAKSKY